MSAPSTDADAIVRSPWRAADPTFVKLLLVSLAAHFTVAATVWAQPLPPEEEVVQEPRWVRGVTRLPFPKRPPPPNNPVPGPGPSQPRGAPSTPRVASKPLSRAALAKAGLLAVIGSYAEQNGGFADVLGAKDPADQLAKSLDGATVGRLATPGMDVGPKEGTGPEVQRIGNIVDDMPPPPVRVPETNPTPVRPPKPPTDFTCILPAQPNDLRGLASFVNARKKAVVSCYERQLVRNRSLKGKLVVRLHLDGPGRPSEVEVDDEGLGSDAVASCVRTVVGGWVFPFAARADVELPFVFDHAE